MIGGLEARPKHLQQLFAPRRKIHGAVAPAHILRFIKIVIGSNVKVQSNNKKKTMKEARKEVQTLSTAIRICSRAMEKKKESTKRDQNWGSRYQYYDRRRFLPFHLSIAFWVVRSPLQGWKWLTGRRRWIGINYKASSTATPRFVPRLLLFPEVGAALVFSARIFWEVSGCPERTPNALNEKQSG